MRRHLFAKSAWAVALSTIFSLPVVAAECVTASAPHSVALLELYTSEGCSSCPPADQWLSGMAAAGFSTDKVIPLALHVDYWDYIGWKDRFAKPTFSGRQRDQVRADGGDFVYTPQVMLNGRDYRGWSSNSRFARDLTAISQTASAANIKLALSKPSANTLVVNTTVATAQKDTVFYIALYENDLVSDVRAGENSGTHLHHDYVVREWLGPFNSKDEATGVAHSMVIKPDWKIHNLGVVAFVQNRSNGEVLQAVNAKVCG